MAPCGPENVTVVGNDQQAGWVAGRTNGVLDVGVRRGPGEFDMDSIQPGDRKFLGVVERLKIYLLLMALAVFLSLLVTPAAEIQAVTSVVGLALCGVFWLTQRLLSFITLLDNELTRVVNVLKRTLPEHEREQFLP